MVDRLARAGSLSLGAGPQRDIHLPPLSQLVCVAFRCGDRRATAYLLGRHNRGCGVPVVEGPHKIRTADWERNNVLVARVGSYDFSEIPQCFQPNELSNFMVARGGIEPPTRGFSVRFSIISSLENQSLAALATPHSNLIKAQFRHSQPGFGTHAIGHWIVTCRLLPA
jgi:hypothetical protein